MSKQYGVVSRRNSYGEQERHKVRSIKLHQDSTLIIQLSPEFDAAAMRISWLFRILEHEVTGRLHRHRFPVYYRCQRKKRKIANKSASKHGLKKIAKEIAKESASEIARAATKKNCWKQQAIFRTKLNRKERPRKRPI